MLLAVFACTALLELYVLRRWLKVDWVTVAIVVAGTALCVDYLSYTSVSERNYDPESHVEYLEYIARSWRLPDAKSCVACGHPPLYYLLAAGWSRLAAPLGLPHELALQWLSLLLFFGFVAVALLVFRNCGAPRSTSWLATALVVFWPSSVLNSVRVHNDALASLLMLTAIYLIAEWDRRERAGYFYAAACVCALSLLTKASGYAVGAALVCVAALRLRGSARPRVAVTRLALAVGVVAAAAALAVVSRPSSEPTTVCQRVLGHACDGRYHPPVVDSPSRFVRFDVGLFVRGQDFASEEPERDLFLNRFASSSLFGVIPLGDELASPWHRAWANAQRLLLLAMLGVGLGALPFSGWRWPRQYRVYVLSSFLLFASLVAFRVRVPNEFHEDFRHIFPVLAPACLAYASSVQSWGRVSRLLGSAGAGVGLLMIASSVAFFVRPAASRALVEALGRPQDAVLNHVTEGLFRVRVLGVTAHRIEHAARAHVLDPGERP